MNLMNKYILLGSLTLSSFLQATIVSFNSWNEKNKHIAVIGERHVTQVPLNDEWGLADKDHNDIFQNHLKQLIRSYKKIGFLIESSSEDVKECQTIKDADQRFISILGKHYLGMNITLPLLAHSKNHSWGAIDFINFDLRSKAIMISLKFVQLLWGQLDQMKGDEETNAIKIFKNLELLFMSCKDTTISEYLKSIDQIIAICAEYDEDSCHIIMELSDRAKELFKNNHDEGTSIYHSFSDLILKNGLHYFMNLFHTLLQPISSFITNLGAKIELKKALMHYDLIVIFGGKNHADYINNYLKNNGFTNELSVEKEVSLNEETDVILPIQDQYLSNELLTKCLQSFTEKIVSCGLRNICTKCKKTEDSELDYKRCSRCKKVYYCSIECQKKDWKEHKPNCIPANTAT